MAIKNDYSIMPSKEFKFHDIMTNQIKLLHNVIECNFLKVFKTSLTDNIIFLFIKIYVCDYDLMDHALYKNSDSLCFFRIKVESQQKIFYILS
ncbi:hypothetical protein ALC62_02304 [Cyphomyrmex costatus]|uniref:Uncharacterized protein n=1 Tax=Cyphomyrmex costatus TaxID=456900 RepID=A0A195D1A3_9HYME|nr:hypothetical protein ALC62_02304 [Cyphomyrmex costatus]